MKYRRADYLFADILLAAGGVYLLRMSPYVAVVSYTTRFTFSPKGVVSFLWHFPYGFPRLPLATALSYAARTFLSRIFRQRLPSKLLPHYNITPVRRVH